jgi:integrative and conjugative element protein (TIGR02256 family)
VGFISVMPRVQPRARMTLIFDIDGTTQRLILAGSVVEHFLKHQQRRWYQREAGGQLFATISAGNITVLEVTGPRKTDRRSRYSYVADRDAERLEIQQKYRDGFHYVGDWHTHPEPVPTPSALDLESIQECVNRSQHGLNAFVLIIVGNGKLPNALHVMIHDGRKTKQLSCV